MITIKKYKLKDLKLKFERRDFAIPEIQRQYVWKKSQIVRLMDSILKHYPIGIGLVWHAPFSKAINIRPNNKTIVPPFNKNARHTELIIDGQQRLSTLYGILKGIEELPDAGLEVNFKELFFNCGKDASARFVFSNRYNENTKGYVRLHDLVNTTPALLQRRLKLTKAEAVNVSKCYSAFHTYSFFMLEFKGSSYEDIKEIFIRINTEGVKVGRADALFAKATDVNLRDNILDTKRGLKNDFNLISVDTMQSALALAYGLKRIGGRELDAMTTKIDRNRKDNKEFNKIWKDLQYGYEHAVDFLVNYLNITHPALLPSKNIYTLLVYFFFLNRARPDPNQIKEIKKWFWHTACGERYSGASFNRNIPEDIKFFEKLAKVKTTKYRIDEKVNSIDFLKSDYRQNSSIALAYFLMLRNNKPAYLLNGHFMMLSKNTASANRKDRHHIFPYALLKRRDVKLKWINSIVNICFLEADENQSIGDTHPKIYLRKYKPYRHFGRVLKNHLIDSRVGSPVWEADVKKGFLSFINMRGKKVIGKIEQLAGVKIFDKLDEIKRL